MTLIDLGALTVRAFSVAKRDALSLELTIGGTHNSYKVINIWNEYVWDDFAQHFPLFFSSIYRLYYSTNFCHKMGKFASSTLCCFWPLGKKTVYELLNPSLLERLQHLSTPCQQ